MYLSLYYDHFMSVLMDGGVKRRLLLCIWTLSW